MDPSGRRGQPGLLLHQHGGAGGAAGQVAQVAPGQEGPAGVHQVHYSIVQYSTVQYSTVHQEAGARPAYTSHSHLIGSNEELQQGVKFPTFQTLKTNLYLNQGEAGLDLNLS